MIMPDNSETLNFLADDDDEDIVDLGISEEEEPEIPTPSIDVSVSKDKLYAYLTLSQTPPQPYQITVESIYDALAAAKVEYGVMLEKIEQMVAGQDYPANELIAIGREMVPGVEGTLEYLFSTAPGGRPKDKGHYVDHYDLTLVENVTAGQVLVRKIPAAQGEAGMSVYGQPLKAPKVKDARLPVGKGTEMSADNPLELVAKIDGFVRLDKHSFNRVVVENVFDVHGDVNLATGNLDIDGSVRVFGGVREGFSVKATGDIKIAGTVEAETLQAGGSIEIKSGVIGGKQGATIIAVDDVSVKFADHAAITAGNTIAVTEEAINCQLQADKSVVVGERSLSAGAIIGGLISAGQEIRAVSVGSDAGALTRLRVGDQPGLIERRRAMQAELKKRQERLGELKQMIAALKQRQADRQPLREQRTQTTNRLEQQQAETYRRMRTILDRAEKEGLVAPAAAIEAMEAEISETRRTLQRVDASIETLNQRLADKPSLSESLKIRKTLEQFQAARENLISKLTSLETQLAQRTANPWKNLPPATRRELEQVQGSLHDIQSRLASLEAEDITDQKIYEALTQLQTEYSTLHTEFSALNDELELIKQRIAAAEKITPLVIVSGKLWAGAEVIIHKRRRRFTTSRSAVKVQLSEKEAIIALNLA